MVEFAMISLVVYLLLAAILTFGHMLFCDQTLQQAADLAAREISRTPLPADAKFRDDNDTTNDVVHNSDVCRRIFDERYLVLKIDAGSNNPITFNGGHPIGDFPLVNQQLLPLMIYQSGVCKAHINTDGSVTMEENPFTEAVLHFPGTMFMDPNPDPAVNPPASGVLVRIPVLSDVPPPLSPGSSGLATVPEAIVSWLNVMEEARSPDNNDKSPFQVSSPQRGIVSLRFNCPYQSASMSGYAARPHPELSPGPGNPHVPLLVGSTSTVNLPDGVGDLVVPNSEFGPYSGAYGLGQQAAWARLVRPYRSLFSAQAIYRREVFSSQ